MQKLFHSHSFQHPLLKFIYKIGEEENIKFGETPEPNILFGKKKPDIFMLELKKEAKELENLLITSHESSNQDIAFNKARVRLAIIQYANTHGLYNLQPHTGSVAVNTIRLLLGENLIREMEEILISEVGKFTEEVSNLQK